MEDQRVEALLTLDGVVIVTGAPDDDVVARAGEDQVVAVTAVEFVGVRPAVHLELAGQGPAGS